MKTKHSRPIDAAEAEHLALVKQCGCVFCNYIGPTEAHHPKGCQGLHHCTISACHDCHEARVWNLGGMTEMQALNETLRRVNALRAGKPSPQSFARNFGSRQHSARTPSKIVPRRTA